MARYSYQFVLFQSNLKVDTLIWICTFPWLSDIPKRSCRSRAAFLWHIWMKVLENSKGLLSSAVECLSAHFMEMFHKDNFGAMVWLIERAVGGNLLINNWILHCLSNYWLIWAYALPEIHWTRLSQWLWSLSKQVYSKSHCTIFQIIVGIWLLDFILSEQTSSVSRPSWQCSSSLACGDFLICQKTVSTVRIDRTAFICSAITMFLKWTREVLSSFLTSSTETLSYISLCTSCPRVVPLPGLNKGSSLFQILFSSSLTR